MNEPKRDPLKPSTRAYPRDWKLKMGMTIMATDALIDGAAWHIRLRWWAWKRWQKGWMYWTPLRRVLKDAAQWFVTSVRAKIGL